MNIKRMMTLKLSKEELQQIIIDCLKKEGFIVSEKDISFDIVTKECGPQYDPWTVNELAGCTISCEGFSNEVKI